MIAKITMQHITIAETTVTETMGAIITASSQSSLWCVDVESEGVSAGSDVGTKLHISTGRWLSSDGVDSSVSSFVAWSTTVYSVKWSQIQSQSNCIWLAG